MFFIKNRLPEKVTNKSDLPQKVINKGLLETVKPVWVP